MLKIFLNLLMEIRAMICEAKSFFQIYHCYTIIITYKNSKDTQDLLLFWIVVKWQNHQHCFHIKLYSFIYISAATLWSNFVKLTKSPLSCYWNLTNPFIIETWETNPVFVYIFVFILDLCSFFQILLAGQKSFRFTALSSVWVLKLLG